MFLLQTYVLSTLQTIGLGYSMPAVVPFIMNLASLWFLVKLLQLVGIIDQRLIGDATVDELGSPTGVSALINPTHVQLTSSFRCSDVVARCASASRP